MAELFNTLKNNYNLYSYKEENLQLLEKVLAGNYSLERLIVDKKTAYIAKINIDSKTYLYKKLYPQIFRKEILSFFREHVSLDILKKTHKYRAMGFSELVDVYGVGIEKKSFGQVQFLLMEYVEGTFLNEEKNFKILENFLIRLHKAKVYHGDAHPYNFILDKNNKLRAFDTKLKKIYIGNLGGHYDMFKLRNVFTSLPPYPYSKNLFYWYCCFRYKKKRFFYGK